MSTIWIINQYASLPSTGSGGRHRHLARELAALGHNVYLIAARWTHLVRDEKAAEAAAEIESFEGFNFVRIPVPRYAHAHDKRRMLNWMLFSWRLGRLKKLIPHPPDVIMCSSPSLFAILGAKRLARKYNARLVFEVRDIWPLTLIEVGGVSPQNAAVRLMQRVEDYAYRIADRVVSNLPGAVEHMVERGMDRTKFAWIPNGFSQADVDRGVRAPAEVIDAIPRGKFVVGYAGTLGVANALETFIEAAERLRAHTDIVFALLGNGREKTALINKVSSAKLVNVTFLPAVPKASVHSVLENFDAFYIGWHKSPLYKFGIAANKLFDYLYSARPIIHSFSGSHDPVKFYEAGLTVEAQDAEALTAAILRIRNMPESERQRMGENGRRAAFEHHEYRMLAKKLEAVLLGNTAEPLDE